MTFKNGFEFVMQQQQKGSLLVGMQICVATLQASITLSCERPLKGWRMCKAKYADKGKWALRVGHFFQMSFMVNALWD